MYAEYKSFGRQSHGPFRIGKTATDKSIVEDSTHAAPPPPSIISLYVSQRVYIRFASQRMFFTRCHHCDVIRIRIGFYLAGLFFRTNLSMCAVFGVILLCLSPIISAEASTKTKRRKEWTQLRFFSID